MRSMQFNKTLYMFAEGFLKGTELKEFRQLLTDLLIDNVTVDQISTRLKLDRKLSGQDIFNLIRASVSNEENREDMTRYGQRMMDVIQKNRYTHSVIVNGRKAFRMRNRRKYEIGTIFLIDIKQKKCYNILCINFKNSYI